MKAVTIAVLAVALLLAVGSVGSAEPVAVRYAEGVTRGFPVLRSVDGQRLAQGELIQVARGDRVDSRLTFRFVDGSFYDERVAFSQQGTFTLQSYRLVQRGPSFPEALDAAFDRETERYTVRYKSDADGPEETLTGKLSLPPDVYNGMLIMLMKNLPAGGSEIVQIVAFTPKPRLVKMQLAPVADERVTIGEWPITATRYAIKPQLGMFVSLLISDLPDVKCWVVGGEAPGFVRFEGPLYFMGPVWRIEPS
ncbi:MAG: hypothetical protein HYU41_09980 [Candidatus Rokubacteria bacterium]|nr:hypothetical protein [Candidatus Rokubacteria bacterium]